MNNFSYTEAKSRDNAISLSGSESGSQFIAGGTNLIDLMKYNIARPRTLVDINAIEDFQMIREIAGGGLSLGALATNADTAYHPWVEQRYPLLSRAILAGASAQIRNMATNGGNLLQRTRCYYFYDVHTPCNKREPGSGCPAIEGLNRTMAILGTSDHCIAVFPSDMSVALAALDASVQVSGPQGSRTIPFLNFHRLPGDTPHIDNCLSENELVTSIDLPSNGFSKNYSYLKLRDRNSYAFALVSVATGLELEGGIIKNARIALGGVAHKPWRVEEAEIFLQNKAPLAENFWYAAEMILKGAKTFQFNAFKVELAKRAIVRNCIMALTPESQLPGAQASV